MRILTLLFLIYLKQLPVDLKDAYEAFGDNYPGYVHGKVKSIKQIEYKARLKNNDYEKFESKTPMIIQDFFFDSNQNCTIRKYSSGVFNFETKCEFKNNKLVKRYKTNSKDNDPLCFEYDNKGNVIKWGWKNSFTKSQFNNKNKIIKNERYKNDTLVSIDNYKYETPEVAKISTTDILKKKIVKVDYEKYLAKERCYYRGTDKRYTTYTFDEYGNLKSSKSVQDGKINEVKYDYTKFDEKNNWVKRLRIFENDTTLGIRTITYFE